jgi:glycosyltransferase involved in cell wall biosynthesis
VAAGLERSGVSESHLFGVLVTFRRPAALESMLQRLAEQDRPPDRLVVVDNFPMPETEAIVAAFQESGRAVEYVASPENVGPGGGVAEGMRRILATADDDDWILVLDDGDPPHSPNALGELMRFGKAMVRRDPMTGGVGIVGARFDWRRGRAVRPRDEELTGPVPVDVIGGNNLPLFRVRAIREAGSFSPEVFFGFEELEHGLRVRKAGYSIYADGERWRQQRIEAGRMGLDVRPSATLAAPIWRRYYSLRNMIYILRSHGRTGAAIRVTLLHGLAKPLANLAVSPRKALRHLRLNGKACWHAWTGRMGRTVEPDSGYELLQHRPVDPPAVSAVDSEVGA